MVKYLFILVGVIVMHVQGEWTSMQLLPTNKSSLEKILDNDRLQVTVINHGGLIPKEQGRSILTIEKLPNSLFYNITYDHYLYKKEASFKVDENAIIELNNIWSTLLASHQPGKSLMGDCVVMDQNLIMESGGDIMEVKPNYSLLSINRLDNWVIEHK